MARLKGSHLLIRNKHWDTHTLANKHTIERRKCPRVMMDVIFFACVGSTNVVAHAVDLSLTGIRFVCPALGVEIGELLQVTLDLRGTMVSRAGKVVRVTNLNASAQELALAFV